MKTDELITMLASGAEAVEPHALQRRFMIALGWGAFGATLLMAIMLGARPDLSEAVRLSRPGVRLGRVPAALAAPVLAMWVLAVVVLLSAAPAERVQLVFGDTWASCPFNVAILSAPAFVALLWAMKGFAPTRLALAGAATGLLAGAVGASVYTLHCPEMESPFLAVWYLLGMLIPTAVGAMLGPRLLRW
jgi:hypothetical protein